MSQISMNNQKKYFGVKAPIIGNFALTAPIKSHSHGFEVSIFIEDDKYKISVVRLVPEQSRLNIDINRIGDYIEPIQPKVPDIEDYKEYIELLQHIEAMGGFNYGITKILYKEALELVWYIGDDIFQNLKPICTMKQQYNPPRKKILTTSNLSSIIFLKKHIPDALIPYNYYREAKGYYDNQDYRMAYLHFYMILEYCFAKGESGRKAQLANFMEDDWLVFSVLDTIKLLKNNATEHYTWLKEKLIEKSKKMNVHDILWLLYDYRGILAHGLKRSAKYIFEDRQLRPITTILSSICFSVCGNMQVYCMSSNEYNSSRIKERICNLKEELNIDFK